VTNMDETKAQPLNAHIPPCLTSMVMEYEPDALIELFLVQSACGNTDFLHNTRHEDDLEFHEWDACIDAPNYLVELCTCNSSSCDAYKKFWKLVDTKRIVDDQVKRIELVVASTDEFDITETLSIQVVHKGTYVTAKDIVDTISRIFKRHVRQVEKIMQLSYDYHNQTPNFIVKSIRAQSFAKGTLTLLLDLDYD
jgi:hypothetical protein